jgi:hypothetical protein
VLATFVVGQPRTGTTVFNEMVATHPTVMHFGEVFNENNPLSFRAFLHSRAHGDVRWLLPSRQINAFLSYVRDCASMATAHKRGATIALFDIKYDQSHFLYDAWYNANEIPRLFGLIKSNNWVMIDIHRERVLDTIISNEIAIRTGVYQSDSLEPQSNTAKIEMVTAGLKTRAANIRRSYQCMESYFIGYQRYLKVTYEDMFDTECGHFKEGLLQGIANFLGIQNLFEPCPRLKKLLRPDSLTHVINADEVRKAMAGFSI